MTKTAQQQQVLILMFIVRFETHSNDWIGFYLSIDVSHYRLELISFFKYACSFKLQ